MAVNEQPRIETERFEFLKNAILQLQEDINTQKTIAETVSEENRKLKSKIQKLTNGQSGLENKVIKMEDFLVKHFEGFIEESVIAINDVIRKAKKEG